MLFVVLKIVKDIFFLCNNLVETGEGLKNCSDSQKCFLHESMRIIGPQYSTRSLTLIPTVG